MADTMQFDLVSPERRLASYAAEAVQIPGADGDMSAMAGHEPTITSLRPGLLTVTGPEGTKEFVVTGGFAQIGENGVTVLAERALPREEMTQELIDEMVATAHETHQAAHPDLVHATAKALSDMVALGGHIGLEARMPNA